MKFSIVLDSSSFIFLDSVRNWKDGLVQDWCLNMVGATCATSLRRSKEAHECKMRMRNVTWQTIWDRWARHFYVVFAKYSLFCSRSSYSFFTADGTFLYPRVSNNSLLVTQPIRTQWKSHGQHPYERQDIRDSAQTAATFRMLLVVRVSDITNSCCKGVLVNKVLALVKKHTTWTKGSHESWDEKRLCWLWYNPRLFRCKRLYSEGSCSQESGHDSWWITRKVWCSISWGDLWCSGKDTSPVERLLCNRSNDEAMWFDLDVRDGHCCRVWHRSSKSSRDALWSPRVSRLSRWTACPVSGPSSVVFLKVPTDLRWTAICVREELVCEGGRVSGDARIWSKSVRCLQLETFRKGAQVLGVRRVDTVKENWARRSFVYQDLNATIPFVRRFARQTSELPAERSLMTLTSVKRLCTGVWSVLNIWKRTLENLLSGPSHRKHARRSRRVANLAKVLQ